MTRLTQNAPFWIAARAHVRHSIQEIITILKSVTAASVFLLPLMLIGTPVFTAREIVIIYVIGTGISVMILAGAQLFIAGILITHTYQKTT